MAVFGDYANWLIDEWNKNGERIHVTGASVDGETYKTKQTIELGSSNPRTSSIPGKAAAPRKSSRTVSLPTYPTTKIRLGKVARCQPAFHWRPSATRSISFRPKIGASVVWYRKDLYEKLGLKVPTTWDELMANAQRQRRRHWPFMLANQKKWPSQFMWSAILVNKYRPRHL